MSSRSLVSWDVSQEVAGFKGQRNLKKPKEAMMGVMDSHSRIGRSPCSAYKQWYRNIVYV